MDPSPVVIHHSYQFEFHINVPMRGGSMSTRSRGSEHEGPEKPQQALRRRMPTVYTMDDKSHVYVYVYNPVGDEQRLENTQSPYSYTHHALTVGEGGFSFIWTIVTRHRYT